MMCWILTGGITALKGVCLSVCLEGHVNRCATVDHDQLTQFFMLIEDKNALVLNCARALIQGKDPAALGS